jgi:hypothetical protein
LPETIADRAVAPVATHYVQSEGTQHVFFADIHGIPSEIWWNNFGPKTLENLSKLAGAQTTGTMPIHSLVAADGSQHVIVYSYPEGFVDLVARP